MKIIKMNNVITVDTDYYSVDGIETVAYLPRGTFPYCDRLDILENEDKEDSIQEIEVNNKRYILKNVIDESDFFILQLDKVE